MAHRWRNNGPPAGNASGSLASSMPATGFAFGLGRNISSVLSGSLDFSRCPSYLDSMAQMSCMRFALYLF
eukprot:5410483-Amphidinium_carterae.1